MTDYYVDNVLGNDGNAGTSEGAGNAWATIQFAADTAVATDIVYVKNTGTDYDEGQIDFDTNAGTASGRIAFIGYTSTITDKGRPTVIGSATASLFALTQHYLQFENFILDGNNLVTTQLIGGAKAYLIIENVKFTNIKTGATYLLNTGSYGNIIDCEFDGSSKSLTYLGLVGLSRVIGCWFHDATIVAFALDGSSGSFDKCIFDTVTYAVRRAASVTNSVFYNTTTGWDLGTLSTSSGNIYDTCTTGFKSTTITGISVNDAFYNCGTRVSGGTEQSSIILTSSPFTDAAGSDFSLNNTAGGGAAVKGVSVPTSINSVTTNFNLGVFQPIPSTSAVAPTFAGITGLERIAPGILKASWSAGSGTITGYKVFVRSGSAPTVADDTYLWGIVDDTKTSVLIDTTEDNDTLLDGTSSIYVIVRAYNDGGTGAEDSGTTALNLTPNGIVPFSVPDTVVSIS